MMWTKWRLMGSPAFLPPEPMGREEGEICRRDGCTGTIVLEDVENCSCHINAPCANHENQALGCDECGISEHDDDKW